MSHFSEIFSRNIGAITAQQQDRLQRSRVAVIGCGGLGGFVIEQLVRLGVGRINCFDPDRFSVSNCNRQLYAHKATLGENKAEAAAERAAAIHPFSTVIAYPQQFEAAKDGDAFQVDVAIDCLDDIQTRYKLSRLCRGKSIPLVHGAVTGWYGQVGVQMPDYDLTSEMFPDPTRTSKNIPPVLSFIVTVIAGLQVAEATKLLLGLPASLENRWLHVDLKNCEFLTLQ